MIIRLIATDIDGTIIPKGGRVSEATKKVFKRAEEMGIPVILTSGRTFYGITGVAKEIGLSSPVISANGGRADMTLTESCVFEDCIDDELSLRVYKRLREAGCFMTSYVGTNIYVMDETNGYGSTCCKRSEVNKPGIPVIANDEKRFLREGTVKPYKYEAYTDDVALIESLRTEFLSWGLAVSSAFAYNLEIQKPGGGKGRALQAIAEKLGVEREEIMAFGDGSNDLTMLEYAGFPVAMGNAVDVLKKIAWKIAPDCAEDGVVQILNDFVLTEANV